MPHRLQDRSFEQKCFGEQVSVSDGFRTRFRESNGEELPLVIPLVQGLADGQALVTLKPDQRDVEGPRQRLGCRGFADSWFALKKQRSAEDDREVERGREAFVDEVVELVEALLYLGSVAKRGGYEGTSIDASSAS
jgi:hypothetical protein